jgi:hypothetical protein
VAVNRWFIGYALMASVMPRRLPRIREDREL